MAEITRPESRSHSQLSAYTDCPRAYELGRVRRIKRRPGSWFPAGTTVHKVIELYLRHSLENEGNGGE